MGKIQIETAQNVKLYQNPASIGMRIAAYFLDTLIIIAYEILVFYIYIYQIQANINGNAEIWVILLVFGLPPFLYHLLFETFNDGQSLGKAAAKIRVVSLDGSPARFSNYLIRWLMRIIDFSLTSGALAVFVILLNGKGQRLGDIAAKTAVISEKKDFSLEQTLWSDFEEDYFPVYTQVTVFSDLEMQNIKTLFEKAKTDNDDKVIQSLSHKIASVMEVQPKEVPIKFIAQVIRDYSYYTQQ